MKARRNRIRLQKRRTRVRLESNPAPASTWARDRFVLELHPPGFLTTPFIRRGRPSGSASGSGSGSSAGSFGSSGVRLEASPPPRRQLAEDYLSDGERLARIETKVGAVMATVGDHELRIRVTERLGYKMFALSAAGAFLGGAITMLIAFLATQ